VVVTHEITICVNEYKRGCLLEAFTIPARKNYESALG
jgi:hypothetical protein